MTDPYLTIQDLCARGWTLGMIRALLGAHDHERWTNKLGHQMSKSIKLYLETRVVHLESSEAFTRAQKRAQAHGAQMLKASQTRQDWEVKTVAQYDALSLPVVQVYPLKEGSTAHQKELWQLHLHGFYVWQREHDHLLSGLTQAMRRAAEHRMLRRYQAAVYQAYGLME